MSPETIFVLKAFAKGAILPPGCFLLLFVAAGAAWAFGRRRLAAAAAALGAGLAIALATPAGSGIFVHFATAGVDHLDPNAPPPAADAIVVLGGGARYAAPEYGRDTVSRSSAMRALYAADLARRTDLPIMVTAAGPLGPNGLGESGTMRLFLEDLGAAPRWVDGSALDTDDSARSARRILSGEGIDRILLVTGMMHMRRAAGLFRAQGFSVVEAPTGGGGGRDRWWRGLIPSAGGYHAVAGAGNELLGRAAYAVSGWVSGAASSAPPEDRDGLR